uniref:Uncharacterized protein n=2 Tax=Pseudoalteromonas rubra TaxID=43658 RepID=A0A0F4QV95_9GAMM|nr:hypothetical protein TW77_06570 [Pseudoalteromonas rubra]
MLLDYQEIGSDSVKRELGLVQQVYTQDVFLKGLFLGARLPEDLEGFRVFKDPINLDMRIQTPDYCYDEPEKWDFQHFTSILEWNEGDPSLYFRFYDNYDDVLAIQKEYKKILYGFADDFYEPIVNRIQKFRTNDQDDAMKKKYSLTSTNLEYIYADLIPNIVLDHFVRIVDIVIFGGLERSPICKRLLDCYRLGGMPGGWVGPLPEDGGTPEQCMELYHLGE